MNEITEQVHVDNNGTLIQRNIWCASSWGCGQAMVGSGKV
jgi:hypothetical protein